MRLRRGYTVVTGNVSGTEIDFIATQGKDRVYLQVAESTASADTLAREVAPFKKAPSGAKCALLTLDRLAPQTGDVIWVDALQFLCGAEI